MENPYLLAYHAQCSKSDCSSIHTFLKNFHLLYLTFGQVFKDFNLAIPATTPIPTRPTNKPSTLIKPTKPTPTVIQIPSSLQDQDSSDQGSSIFEQLKKKSRSIVPQQGPRISAPVCEMLDCYEDYDTPPAQVENAVVNQCKKRDMELKLTLQDFLQYHNPNLPRKGVQRRQIYMT